jgi:hypothetical protein
VVMPSGLAFGLAFFTARKAARNSSMVSGIALTPASSSVFALATRPVEPITQGRP